MFYDALAPTYIGRFERPAAFLRAVDTLLPERLVPGAQVLDLCCGTGALAGAMAERGARVVGVDASEPMIVLARAHVPGVTFEVQDARALAKTATFDLVTSTFDSLNHLLVGEELADVFRRVAEALKPGGHFLFDLNAEEGFLERWKGHFETGGATFRFSFDRATQLGTCSYEAASGEPVRVQERCYPEAAVRGWLEAAHFHDIDFVDARRSLGWNEPGRQFWVARKRRSAAP